MLRLSLLFLLVLSFSCTDSKEEFDTSPFSDNELLPYEPLWDLMDAVYVFEKKHQELPINLSSLKSLSRQDYIDACVTDGVSDSIIVDNRKLNFFSESKTIFITTTTGLEVQYAFKDSSLLWFEEWQESLYSTDFDSYTFSRFTVFVKIKKGNGLMKFQLDSNKTEIIVDELSGSFGLSPAQEFHFINERFIMEKREYVCFEE